MSSLLLALVLMGGGGQRPAEDPTLPVLLQLPGKDGDPARMVYFDWATGRERWSTSLPLKHVPEGGAYLRVAGPDLWAILFSAAHGNLLVAVSLATGRERFRVAGRYLGAPFAEGSTAILFHQQRNGVVAIDATTGAELWRRPDLNAFTEFESLLDRRIVLHVGDNYLALDPVTGADRWSLPDARGDPEDAGDLIWFSNPALVGIDPKTGEERRRLKAPVGRRFFLFSGGNAYFKGTERLDALRLKDGAPAWSLDLDAGQTAGSAWETRGRIQVEESPSNRTLWFDAGTGRRIFALDFPASESRYTTLHNGRLGARRFGRGPRGFVNLWIFDVLRGRILWKGEADDEWGSTVRDEAYGVKDRTVFRVDVDRGGALWTLRLPEPPIAKLAGPGRTALTCGDRLLCLDSATGQLLWDARLSSGGTPFLGAFPLR